MKKLFIITFLIFSVACFAQDTKGTIKVKKADTSRVEIPLAEALDPTTMPSFPGGDTAMTKYLSKSVRYPELEKEMGIQGKVYVSFVVLEDGSISDVKLLRGVSGGPGLDNEALRVVKMMPKWTPAKKLDGKPVKVRYTLPINFYIK